MVLSRMCWSSASKNASVRAFSANTISRRAQCVEPRILANSSPSSKPSCRVVSVVLKDYEWEGAQAMEELGDQRLLLLGGALEAFRKRSDCYANHDP